MTKIRFATKRFVVRDWTQNDVPAIHALYRQDRVIRWVGDGTPLSRENAARWLEITQNNYAQYGYGMFAIEHHDGHILGHGGMTHPGRQPTAEVKYAIDPPYWGQGYASEFVTGLTRFARDLGLPALTATAATDNAASCHILRKCGFAQGTRTREADGTFTDRFDLNL